MKLWYCWYITHNIRFCRFRAIFFFFSLSLEHHIYGILITSTVWNSRLNQPMLPYIHMTRRKHDYAVWIWISTEVFQSHEIAEQHVDDEIFWQCPCILTICHNNNSTHTHTRIFLPSQIYFSFFRIHLFRMHAI